MELYIKKEKDSAIVVIAGDIDERDLFRLTQIDTTGSDKWIYDLSNVGTLPEAQLIRLYAMSTVGNPRPAVEAWVGTRPAVFGLCRMWQILSQQPGTIIIVAHDLAEAYQELASLEQYSCGTLPAVENVQPFHPD